MMNSETLEINPTTTTTTTRSDLWSSKKKKNQVFIEGYVVDSSSSIEANVEDLEGGSSKGVSRTVSLTDEDLDELKGCVDLGFGFSYEEIPELCSTLPALELCYSINQKFLDDQQQYHINKSSTSSDSNESVMANTESSSSCSSSSSPIANWKISSPGDHPEEVKARLKFWAQAVACTVKLCS